MALNDIIVGFVYGSIDEFGLFSVEADSNRIYVGAQEVTPAYRRLVLWCEDLVGYSCMFFSRS